ncbi:hypothetical protein GCM10009719_16950 [Nocardioides kribbensis]
MSGAGSSGLSDEKAQNSLTEWATAMQEYLAAHPDHDLTAEDVVGNALTRARWLPSPDLLRTVVHRVEALAEQYERDAESEDYGGELWSATAAALRAALDTSPGEPEIGCGGCGEPLDPERGLYAGSAAYCEPCSEQVYGDHTRPGKPSRSESPCCPGAGSMAHVRGCRNHPEAAS